MHMHMCTRTGTLSCKEAIYPRRAQKGIAKMSSYHTTQHLVKSLDTFSCGTTFQVKTIGNTVDKWPIKQVLLNAASDEADKLTHDAEKLRVLLSFGVHGREYFASELGFKCANWPQTANCP